MFDTIDRDGVRVRPEMFDIEPTISETRNPVENNNANNTSVVLSAVPASPMFPSVFNVSRMVRI